MPIQVIPAPQQVDPMQQLGQWYELFNAMQMAPLKRQAYEAQIANAEADRQQSLASTENMRVAADVNREELAAKKDWRTQQSAKSANTNKALLSTVASVVQSNPALAPYMTAIPTGATDPGELPFELQGPVRELQVRSDPVAWEEVQKTKAMAESYRASAAASHANAKLDMARITHLGDMDPADKASNKALSDMLNDINASAKDLDKQEADARKEMAKAEAGLVATAVPGKGVAKEVATKAGLVRRPWEEALADISAKRSDLYAARQEILKQINPRLVALGTAKPAPVDEDGGPEVARINPAVIEQHLQQIREAIIAGDDPGAKQALSMLGIPLDSTKAREWADRTLTFLPATSPQRKMLTGTVSRLAGIAGGQMTLEGLRKAGKPAMDVAFPGTPAYANPLSLNSADQLMRGYLPIPSEVWPETPRSPRVEAGTFGTVE